MKYLLLDVEDTIALKRFQGKDVQLIEKMGIEFYVPNYIAKWLKESYQKDYKIIWCTSCSDFETKILENQIGFKVEDKLVFTNPKAYRWKKLYTIIKFCDNHPNDLIILADNDIMEGTSDVKDLPSNLRLVQPSNKRYGCLSIEDLEFIDNLQE